MNAIAEDKPSSSRTLTTLPSDDVRQIMWRFADRYDLHMLVQAARGVARGPVARLVAGWRQRRAFSEAISWVLLFDLM